MRSLLVLCVVLLVPRLAIAEGDAEGPAPAERRPLWSGSWEPPEADPRGWDWVRLTSDEWVKGEILVMRDFELKFDSDEFDVVTFDWDDVAEIVTSHRYIVTLQNLRTSVQGTLTMKGDRVRIRVGGDLELHERAQVLAITPSDERELNLWTGDASAGLSLRSGNTDESQLTGRLRLEREARRTRLGFDYQGTYGSLNSRKNTNNHRGSTRFDYFLTRDLFLVVPSFEAFTDEFQNIAYRLTTYAGVGYYVLRLPAVEWQVGLGLGHQRFRLDSAQPGEGKFDDNAAIVFNSLVDADLTSRVDLVLSYQGQLIAPDTDATNHHTQATLEVELTSILDLDIDFVWDRIEKPQQDENGQRPESDDFRLTAGLSLEF
jgi:putative salt-induced outer membrane protein YdiY